MFKLKKKLCTINMIKQKSVFIELSVIYIVIFDTQIILVFFFKFLLYTILLNCRN